MRSIFIVAGMFVMGTLFGCANLLGIEPWEDKLLGGGGAGTSSSGGGSSSSDVSSSVSSSGETSSSSGEVSTCHSGVQDGVETGVDCGGGDCAPCDDGYGCKVDGDCNSNYCPISRGYCVPQDGRGICGVEDPDNPSCGDCVKNATETDVDCGGDCLPCRSGNVCVFDGDCWSNSCSNGTCAIGASKTRCFSNTDCQSGICANASVMSDCNYESCCQ